MKKTAILILIITMFTIEGFSDGGKTGIVTKKNNLTENSDTITLANFDTDSFDSADELLKRRRRGGRNAFSQGKSYISGGYGLGNVSFNRIFSEALALTSSLATIGYSTTMPAAPESSVWGVLHIRYDYGVWEKFSIGSELNFSSYNITYESTHYFIDINGADSIVVDENGYKGMTINLLGRIDWHLFTNKKVDIYTGLAIGYSINTRTYYSDDIDQNPELNDFPDIQFPIALGGTFGMRYFFNKEVAAYAEIGYNTSYANLGVTFKF